MGALSFVPNNATTPTGPLSSLSTQQYDFQDFTYPLDLGSLIDGQGDSLLGHWVTFFINQSNNTQYTAVVPTVATGTTTSNPIATVVGPLNTSNQSQVNQNNPSNGVNQTTNTQNTSRVPIAISLYMPPNIQTTYAAQWSETELGFAGNAVQAYQTAKSTGDIMRGLKQGGSAFIQQVVKDISSAADTFTDALGAGSVSGAVGSALRVAINPHAEVLFSGISFRAFQFDFKFTPRSEDEAIAADNIMQAFKFYAAPEINQGISGPFWIYPGTFDIQFYSNGKPNNYLNKISTCALTSIDINYCNAGVFTSFYPGRVLRGVTTETSLTLKFTELEIIHKSRINEGY